MITPRRTRLVRVPDLQAFRAAIAALVRANPEPLVIVPTSAASHQLMRFLPDARCATRDELYDRLHGRLADPPARLTAIERDVVAQAAARAAAAAGIELTFKVRPGLVAEMLRFYDQLRRHSKQVDRFEELIDEALGSVEDRAAERMRRQTRFLADAFREYERRVRASGACDEHLLRERLLVEPAGDPVRAIVVTVPDWIADPDGLYVADFDLVARIHGLKSLDIVATEAVLASGFEERLHGWLPGIEAGEVGRVGQVSRAAQVADRLVYPPDRPDPRGRHEPVIVTPPGAEPDEPWWTVRDREEEVIAVARRLCANGFDIATLDRTAVVFKRPLPYLYLAPTIFADAGIAWQTSAALPLAAEPAAAALDLVLDVVSSKFTRSTIVALLRSPHFRFGSAEADALEDSAKVVDPCGSDGAAAMPEDGASDLTSVAISALDRALSDARYLGGKERLSALAAEWTDAGAEPALRAALAIVERLAPLAGPRPASGQIATLRGFWSAHLREFSDLTSREQRARGAVDALLTSLESAHKAQDDPPWTIDDLAVAVRRAIEEATFTPDASHAGVHFLDDQAARYGDFDDITIVGVVETDWPETPRRNIFYPPGLIKALGWPPEQDRRAAADARFIDLLRSAAARTAVSTFTLDDDALVTRSVQLDEIARARLSSVPAEPGLGDRLFVDERLGIEPPLLDRLDGEAREWAELRLRRTAADAPEFHGTIPADALPTQPWAVSALETYLECPFKFFARRVLKLEEEPDDEEVMDPRRQGQFVHEVFERFFTEWQTAGHREITTRNLGDARAMFVDIVDSMLETLPEAEAGLERARLLGSPAAAGLGEAVFRMEAERSAGVGQRLLEHDLRGEFTFTAADGPRTIPLRGKVDRLDLLEDGTFRLIDYKLGRAPNRTRALQLPIYGLCAEQQLPPRNGRRWRLGEAAYLAFKGPRRVVPLFAAGDRERVLNEAQQRLVDTVDAIARGEFPPTPEDVYRCELCSFPTVCRKDYVGDV